MRNGGQAPVSISRDSDIRVALLARFKKRYGTDKDVVVVEELPVCRGTVRADLAVISDRIEGYEIKSGADTLKRLPRQVEYYGQALNRMMLVVDQRHINLAVTVIPDWWGIISADMGARRGISFRRVRPGRINPGRTVDGVAALMEREELLGVLSSVELDRGWRSKPAWQLHDRIVEHLSLAQVTAGACRQLKLRAYLEQRYESTAFGRAAFGGGLAEFSALAPEQAG